MRPTRFSQTERLSLSFQVVAGDESDGIAKLMMANLNDHFLTTISNFYDIIFTKLDLLSFK